MPPPPETLSTPRLRLALLSPASLEPALDDLYELRTFESVMRWTRTGTIDASRDATREWALARIKASDCAQYLVQLPLAPSDSTGDAANVESTESSSTPDSYKTIGAIGVVKMPEIGYLMHPSYYGKGYATEAIARLMQAFWDFAELNTGERATFATAVIDATNGGSRRVLEKCGFQKVSEGVEGPIRIEHWTLARPGTSLPDSDEVLEKSGAGDEAPGAGIA